MERPNFNNWLNIRQNIVKEGLFDKIFNNKNSQSIESPEQIYTNSEVDKYYRQVVQHFMLDQQLDFAQNNQKYNGQVPPLVEKTIKKFIASFIFGDERKSFLRVSQHDAGFILNFLDGLKVTGEHQSIAQRFGITNLMSLSHWFETNLPTSPNAVKQMGFEKASNAYISPSYQKEGGPFGDARVKDLATSAVKVINSIHSKLGTSNRRITKDIIDAVKEMRSSLETLGVLKPLSPEQERPADPDIIGYGRTTP